VPPWSSLNPVDSVEWHYQGIAPYNGPASPTIANGCIAASSDSGYFSGFSQAPSSPDAAVNSVVVPDSRYFHTGGLQMLGDLLPVPLESTDESLKGRVDFYDVGQLSRPVRLYVLEMPGRKASAAAITNYTDSSGVEQCLMVVYEYDHHQMYVYQAPASSVTGPSQWRLMTTYSGPAFDTGDQYQAFGLVTQTGSSGDVVYLVGFREDEEVWLWIVDTTPGSSFGQFTNPGRYTGWNGSDFRNGTGLQIPNSTLLRIFGTSKDPSGSSKYPGGPAKYEFEIYGYAYL
jgi:hypothetical protein